MFKTLVKKMELIDVVRCFIAILYLAMKEKIILESIEEIDDIKIIIKS
jgi:chromatin segregation and condensation protein Rec8/ScpA/Scc1 (kleisin family)